MSQLIDGELEDILEDYSFSDDNKLQRTILHRVCLDQNLHLLGMHLEKIKKKSTTVEQCFDDIADLLALQDIYGNTPLALACLRQSEAKESIKRMMIKFLLESGANPNVFNKHTGFTPMHWCARYGELESVQALSDAGANEYIPDFMGFTPLDYAGKFEHWKVVEYLVKRLRERCAAELKKGGDFVYDGSFSVSKKEKEMEKEKELAVGHRGRANGAVPAFKNESTLCA